MYSEIHNNLFSRIDVRSKYGYISFAARWKLFIHDGIPPIDTIVHLTLVTRNWSLLTTGYKHP